MNSMRISCRVAPSTIGGSTRVAGASGRNRGLGGCGAGTLSLPGEVWPWAGSLDERDIVDRAVWREA